MCSNQLRATVLQGKPWTSLSVCEKNMKHLHSVQLWIVVMGRWCATVFLTPSMELCDIKDAIHSANVTIDDRSMLLWSLHLMLTLTLTLILTHWLLSSYWPTLHNIDYRTVHWFYTSYSSSTMLVCLLTLPVGDVYIRPLCVRHPLRDVLTLALTVRSLIDWLSWWGTWHIYWHWTL